MQNNDNRKIFLNVKETLNANQNINNVEIQLDDKQYVVSADINSTSKLAFGIKKTDGIAFIKASVKTNGITDEQITDICEPIVEDRNVNYAIQINKVVFQSVIPVRATTLEENNKFVFEEVKNFVEAVSICCEKLGDGHIIYLNYKEYGKKEVDVDNPLGETILVTPNTDIVKETEIREEINRKESKREIIEKQNNEVVDDESEIKDLMSNSVISVADFMGSDMSDSFTAIPSDEFDIEETEDVKETPKKIFSGSIPVDDIDDINYNTELIDDIPLIIKDEDSEENIENIDDEKSSNVKQDSIDKEVISLEGNVAEKEIKQETTKAEDHKVDEKPKINNESIIDTKDIKKTIVERNKQTNENRKTEENDLNSSMQSLKEKMNQEKELIKQREIQLEEEKERRREPIGEIKNENSNKYNQNSNTEKNNERKNEKQKQNGGYKLDKDNKPNINNIFANYERDLKNVENKYKNQIRNLSIDELLQLIENRYNQDDTQAIVSDYIKEKLCNIAKDELKFRLK